ncbi:hypothetical protein VIM7927_03426 [Vibrio mangrovi]|nr:hypothetical protein VIM7927_03426 [Vibrio mangrovi]
MQYHLIWSSISDDTLILNGAFEQKLNIRFACTPYYQVNLYNQSGVPAMPFEADV